MLITNLPTITRSTKEAWYTIPYMKHILTLITNYFIYYTEWNKYKIYTKRCLIKRYSLFILVCNILSPYLRLVVIVVIRCEETIASTVTRTDPRTSTLVATTARIGLYRTCEDHRLYSKSATPMATVIAVAIWQPEWFQLHPIHFALVKVDVLSDLSGLGKYNCINVANLRNTTKCIGKFRQKVYFHWRAQNLNSYKSIGFTLWSDLESSWRDRRRPLRIKVELGLWSPFWTRRWLNGSVNRLGTVRPTI